MEFLTKHEQSRGNPGLAALLAVLGYGYDRLLNVYFIKNNKNDKII
jgi:hypothetical protein